MPANPTGLDRLGPTDPPILLAGLIAARRAGDKLLEDVLRRELMRRGIDIRFFSKAETERETIHAE
jgi:hypothetical protein